FRTGDRLSPARLCRAWRACPAPEHGPKRSPPASGIRSIGPHVPYSPAPRGRFLTGRSKVQQAVTPSLSALGGERVSLPLQQAAPPDAGRLARDPIWIAIRFVLRRALGGPVDHRWSLPARGTSRHGPAAPRRPAASGSTPSGRCPAGRE